jgi:extradiol dioxygenase family protein
VPPILHLSLPVADLGEARHFYVDVLGCGVGRDRPGWFDVWFCGMQITMHEAPDQLLPLEADNVRHFGVTLAMDQLDRLIDRLDEEGVRWVSPVRTDDSGTDREQRKTKLSDPSGNVIELKAYADPVAALEIPQTGSGPLGGIR